MSRQALIEARDGLTALIDLSDKAGTTPSISVVAKAKDLANLDLNKAVRSFYREGKKALLTRVKGL